MMFIFVASFIAGGGDHGGMKGIFTLASSIAGGGDHRGDEKYFHTNDIEWTLLRQASPGTDQGAKGFILRARRGLRRR